MEKWHGQNSVPRSLIAPGTIFFLCTLACSPLVQPSTASNILLLPFAYRSHVSQMSVIGSGLRARGHSVHVLLPESYPDLDGVREKFDVIVSLNKYLDFYTMPASQASNVWEAAIRLTPVEDLRTNVEGFLQFCTNPLEDDTLPGKIAKLRIDLALVDGFPNTRCYYILLHNLGIPYASLTTQYEPWVWRNLAPSSYVPFPLAGGRFTDRMTFGERVLNLWALVDWSAFPGVEYVEDDFVRRYLKKTNQREDPVTYASLAAKSALWLIDADWSMEFPRPSMPNEINVGGLSTRPANPLSGDIKEFVDGASKNGLILATFGTSDILSEEHLRKLLGAFGRVKQRALLRYTGQLTPELETLVPSNVKLSAWLPQNDVLGHAHTRLFLTHAGANGQFEALYHAVPTIAFPLFGDQPHNALRAQHFGCGLTLNIHTFSEGQLVDAMQEVLSNASYKENISRRSAIFRSARETPSERAVWWIEHVMRHGSAHLHAAALDMPWYELLMLDVMIVIVVLPSIAFGALCAALCFWGFVRARGSERRKVKSS